MKENLASIIYNKPLANFDNSPQMKNEENNTAVLADLLNIV